jgi:leucyl/phenylalanyl-tRNA---protein transferase
MVARPAPRTIPLLRSHDPFPPVIDALDEPDGLLAAGADLSISRLLDAYSRGIFPWFNAGDPILWWSPNPRMVLAPRDFHVSHSLRKRLRSPSVRVTADTIFDRVLAECAAPRDGEVGTWLIPAMQTAYGELHRIGVAHSIEVWMDGVLAGGLYGVALGRMFFGESMFTRQRDGSKVALAYLSAQLARWDVPLIDCQLDTEHLRSLGAYPVARDEFVRQVAALVQRPPMPARWTFDADLHTS